MKRFATVVAYAGLLFLALETIAVLCYFCVAGPLFAGGTAFDDEVAPKPLLLGPFLLFFGLAVTALNAWAASALWALRRAGRDIVEERGALAGGALAALLLIGFAQFSGEYLFTILALPVLLVLVPLSARACRVGARRGAPQGRE
ncbi:hypothetical protein ACFRMQ_11795, partial [Kitasatospora sp. NPDC056783]|uniref:hypothetical protein n=1 Tax=Kitasatospora sp. NPDC056783 TaxID=3345943 RepID=UPI0036B8747B